MSANKREPETPSWELKMHKVFDANHTHKIGVSTRIADASIQELFTNGIVAVRDHHDADIAHRFLFDRIVSRLKLEHPFTAFKTDFPIIELESKS